MTWVEHQGVRLYMERAGSGPRLLFISGTGGDLRLRPNAFDSPLASRFDLVSYDQRGLGQSDQPPAPYSMADYADDAAAVLDALGWPQARVVGVSFGGMVAQEVALRHPQRVERLVLVCTSSGGEGGASYPLHELTDMSPTDRAQRMIEILDTRWAGDAATDPYREQMLPVLLARPSPTPGARRQLEARRHHDTWNRLPAIACPTFVCAGRYDGIADPANSRRLAERIPGARLSFYEGGHPFLYQDPQAFVDIAAFLDEPPA
jgi:3-oxoadipate enol-lactonase